MSRTAENNSKRRFLVKNNSYPFVINSIFI
jgi:hypothetical protein